MPCPRTVAPVAGALLRPYFTWKQGSEATPINDTLLGMILWIAAANAELQKQAEKIAELEKALAEAKG